MFFIAYIFPLHRWNDSISGLWDLDADVLELRYTQKRKKGWNARSSIRAYEKVWKREFYEASILWSSDCTIQPDFDTSRNSRYVSD